MSKRRDEDSNAVEVSDVGNRGSPTTAIPRGKSARLLGYAWWLTGSAVVGVVVGIAAHYAWFTMAPVYKPTVMFEVSPPVRHAAETPEVMSGQEEINRFMTTQKTRMTDDGVLGRVATSPELQNRAKNWSRQFMKNGAFNSQEALKELRDIVDARIVTGTMWIELSVTYSDKVEATDIVKLVKDKYIDNLNEQGRRTRDNRMQSLREGIERAQEQVDQRTSELNILLRTNSINLPISAAMESLSSEVAAMSREIIANESVLEHLMQKRELLIAAVEQPSSLSGDELHRKCEQDGELTELKSVIESMRSFQRAILESGRPSSDPDFQRYETSIHEREEALRNKRQELLRRALAAELANIDGEIERAESTRLRLIVEKSEQVARGIQLSALSHRVEDINRAIDRLRIDQSEIEKSLAQVKMLDSLENANRVIVARDASVPNEVEFPRLPLMSLVGVACTVGVTCIRLALRELQSRPRREESERTRNLMTH